MASLFYLFYELMFLLAFCAAGVLPAWLVLRRRMSWLRAVLISLLSVDVTAGLSAWLSCSFSNDNGVCVDTGRTALRNRLAPHVMACVVLTIVASGLLAGFYFRSKDRTHALKKVDTNA